MTANTEQLNLRISKTLMAKLRGKQVLETIKEGRSVSLQKLIMKLIEDMIVT
jgi:hypothetical protein